MHTPPLLLLSLVLLVLVLVLVVAVVAVFCLHIQPLFPRNVFSRPSTHPDSYSGHRLIPYRETLHTRVPGINQFRRQRTCIIIPVAWYVVRGPIKINFVGSSLTECMLVAFSCKKKLISGKCESVS